MLILDMLRHGAIEFEGKGIFYGRTDFALSETGRAQAAAAGRRFRGERYDAIVCSPLDRTRETLQIAAKEAQWPLEGVRYDVRLQEMDFGLLEGYDFARIAQEYPAIAKSVETTWGETAFEGGESVASFFARVQAGLADITAMETGKVLVVCHGGVIKAAICLLLGLPPQTSTQLACEFACLTRFHITGDWASLRAFNL